MSAVGATEVLKPILLRSSTPGPNEKVLLYLEGMRDSQMSQIGSPLSSGFPNLQQPSPNRSTISAARLDDASRSQASYRNGDDGDRDEIDSNVQEGRKSEITIGIRSTGMPEPGPQDPPGPHYESFDSGPSFGNLGPLPDNGHNSVPPLWTTWAPNWPSSTPHTGVNVPLPMSMASPTSASLQINIEPPSSASGSKTRQSRSRSHSQSQVSQHTKSRKSGSIVESEDRATVTGPAPTRAPSRATKSVAPGDDPVMSSRSHVSAMQSQSQVHSVRSRSTTKVQSRTGTDYPPLPPSTLLSPSGRTTQLLSSPRSHRREPSVSPSDSPSQAYLKKAPQSPGKEKVRSMVSGGGMSDGEAKARAMSSGPMSPSHHNRPFSPYRHAATHEDLLFAASSATQTQVQQRQQSVLSRSEAGNKVRSSKLSDIHSHQSRSHRSHSHVEADGGKTPTPSRPESPSFSLNPAEEELVAAALASRGPRTRTSYAPSALETEIVNSHFHDMDLCILLHQMDDTTTHEVVKKALRKAVRQRVKKLGMDYDPESIKQYHKSFHNHDPSVHLDVEFEPNTREPPEWAKELMNGMIKMHERLDVLSPQSLPVQMPPRSQASYASSTATREQQYRMHTEYTDGGEEYEQQTPRTQTVNINTQPTGTMAESMFQPGETEIMDNGTYGDEVDNDDDDDGGAHMHGFGATTITETRGISDFMTGDRDDSPGQQFLEEELYKLRVKPGGSQSAITHKTWEVARDDQDEYEEGHGAFTESGLPEIPDSGNYTDRRPSSPPLPPIPLGQDGSSRRDMVPSQNSQLWNQAGGEFGETLPPPWQRIHQRLLSWAIIWPMSEIDGALNSTTRGQQVDEVALSIWSTQTYKRYVRSRMTDSPGGRVDRLFVPPNMADAISTAVFNGRHGDACGMLRDLWAPFGLEGSPRLIVVLAKHRSDENHWVVHRFSLPDGALTTYDSYPERTLPDGRPLGWWFAIRVAWPGAIYANPDHLMQKMVRLHRPMQLNIDNSVAAAGIWRNVLMGSRAERSLDLERLRDLINTEVKNLRQRKLQGKLSLGSPKPNWEDR